MKNDMYTAQKPAVSTSGMAIAGLVLGIIALLGCLIPILNNIAFLFALLGLIFSIVGLVGILKGKHTGKGLAIAALVICILSGILVFASQSIYSSAIDEATSGSDVASVTTADTSDETDTADTSEIDYSNLALGTTVTLDSGLEVTVNSVEAGLINYDGSEVTGVSVTYTNNGNDEASFNAYDWEGQDADGVQRYTTYYESAENELNSGTLASGGTVTGNVYFDGSLEKILYTANIFADSSTAAWVVS